MTMSPLTNAEPVLAQFHIGDSPMDLLAAKEAGAKPIGVATGMYSKNELEACGAGQYVAITNHLASSAIRVLVRSCSLTLRPWRVVVLILCAIVTDNYLLLFGDMYMIL